jgi:hypothetical protein
MSGDTSLKAIRAAYYEAGRVQPADYPPLPSWQSLEGRKSHAEARPEVVLEAKRLRRASPLNGKRRSFRKISRELAEMGHASSRRTRF